MYEYPRLDVFSVFEELISTNYETVLDYGGNRGNLIYFSNGKIIEENYTVIDVDKDALEDGKKDYPKATWLISDNFNFMYNADGNKNSSFPNISGIDCIFSFSVFTHTDLHELEKTLKWMISLNPEKIMISFLSATSKSTKDLFYKKRIDTYGSCVDFRNTSADCFYLIDNDIIIEDKVYLERKSCDYFLSFYSPSFLIDYFSKKGIECSFVDPINSHNFFLIWDKNGN